MILKRKRIPLQKNPFFTTHIDMDDVWRIHWQHLDKKTAGYIYPAVFYVFHLNFMIALVIWGCGFSLWPERYPSSVLTAVWA